MTDAKYGKVDSRTLRLEATQNPWETVNSFQSPISRSKIIHFKMADEVKKKALEEISAFINQSVCEMETILHKLDWSKDKLLEAVLILLDTVFSEDKD